MKTVFHGYDPPSRSVHVDLRVRVIFFCLCNSWSHEGWGLFRDHEVCVILTFISPGLFLYISRFHNRMYSRFVVYPSLLCVSTSGLVSVCVCLFVHLCHIIHAPLSCCISSSFILVSVALRVLLRFAFLSRSVKCLQLCFPPARTLLVTYHLEFVFCFFDRCELSVDSAINTHFMFTSVCCIRDVRHTLHGRLWHRRRKPSCLMLLYLDFRSYLQEWSN